MDIERESTLEFTTMLTYTRQMHFLSEVLTNSMNKKMLLVWIS